MGNLRKRTEKENPVHAIHPTKNKGYYIVRRLKEPYVAITYNSITKTGERLHLNPKEHSINPDILNTKEFTEKQIEGAINKAIAWAKHNIKSNSEAESSKP